MSSFLAEIEPIQFGGPDTYNALAYRWYDARRIVFGKTLEEHLRLAVCYWHTFGATGSDPFGSGTWKRPWQEPGEPMELAGRKLEEAFAFVRRLGLRHYTFHDRDVAPEMASLRDSQRAFARMVDRMAAAQEVAGIRPLWGTANLFSHPRYMAGAATNPDPDVFACAAWQVRDALEATHRLGGSAYVLWGGREGYDTLLNTDLKRELQQLGRFLNLVVEHKHRIGFAGPILVEPKPMEPCKHQYDFDVASVHGFLQRHGLADEVKLNIECNHATLAGHSFEHEVALAAALGCLGSIDANRGDPQNGWDTDQFPNDEREMALALYHILKAGGLPQGGFNFDARVRRQSIDALDLAYAHVGAIDTVAKAFLIAARMIEDDHLAAFRDARYSGWESGLGRQILDGELSLATVADLAAQRGLNPLPRSGRQEMLENLVGRYSP